MSRDTTAHLQSSNQRVNPWVWPGILIALPCSVIVASAITAVFIVRHPEGLVADDYYKQGKAINANLSKLGRAQEVGAGQVVLRKQPGGVLLSFPAATSDLGALEVVFAHPVDPARDKTFVLAPSAIGRYDIALDNPFTERRRVLITDLPKKRWRSEAVFTPTTVE